LISATGLMLSRSRGGLRDAQLLINCRGHIETNLRHHIEGWTRNEVRHL
jgi:hypothetical protein